MQQKKPIFSILKVAAASVLGAVALAAPAANETEAILSKKESFSVLKKANDGYAHPAYATQAEAQQAAIDLNIQLTAEGSVLLKNKDSALPLAKATEKVTVFGSAASSLQGGSGNVRTDCKNAENRIWQKSFSGSALFSGDSNAARGH